MRLIELGDRAKAHAEFAGKAALMIIFASGATKKLFAIASLLHEWTTIEPATRWTYLAAHVSALAFILLLILTTVIRRRPLRNAEGIEPRLSALAGTFLGLTLG